MAEKEDWVIGYARQAKADFESYQRLQHEAGIPRCHKLQFLQMACEKLVKAHLIKGGAEPQALQSSHAYITATLPRVIRDELLRSGARLQNVAWNLQHAAPSRGGNRCPCPGRRRGGVRQDNCEYPWADAAGTVRVPVDWPFKASELLLVKAAPTFLKSVFQAIMRLQPPPTDAGPRGK